MIATRDIKRKIRTVQNLEQICRAMKTVASIRLRRAEQRLARARPYRRRLSDLVRRLASLGEHHAFLGERPVQRIGVFLVTSDRGLCGGYNASAIRAALGLAKPERMGVLAVGRKGLVHMSRWGYDVLDSIVPLGGEPDAFAIYRLARRAGELYRDGVLDRLVLVYSRSLGGTSSEMRVDTVLPVSPVEADGEDIILEPELSALLPGLMERYLQSELLGAALEGSASEHGARVAAMTAATDNAEDMIRQLTLDYNKARQAGITSELTEIVSAGEATG